MKSDSENEFEDACDTLAPLNEADTKKFNGTSNGADILTDNNYNNSTPTSSAWKNPGSSYTKVIYA